MKMCSYCASYNSGRGTNACLKCPKYKEVVQQTIGWETHNIVTMPEIMIEAFPDRTHEDNGVYSALQSLDCLSLAIVILRKQYGRTVEEIAKDMHLAESTVKLKTSEAIGSLKIILNPMETDAYEDFER